LDVIVCKDGAILQLFSSEGE
jgi:hypothetical protein